MPLRRPRHETAILSTGRRDPTRLCMSGQLRAVARALRQNGLNYSVSQKTQNTWLLIITSANVDQFTKFFHS